MFSGNKGWEKLHMPIFEVKDIYGCVYNAEKCFAVNGLMEDEKLMAVA